MTNLPTKALSIRQPWAWAILRAGKDVENRSRRFHYRGPICIHASLWDKTRDFREAADFIERIDMEHEVPLSAWPEIQRGGIIGTAEIVDCFETSSSPWFFGPYGLVLRNVQPVEFIPVRGALGLFDWRKMMEVK